MRPPVRVLIVDDDPLVRAGLRMMLDRAPVRTPGDASGDVDAAQIAVVGEAADGDEVSGAVDAHSPDVVLMDLRMPRVDGITATTRLRRRPRPPRVIVLTTFDTDENILHALRAGAAGFLLKDTPPARLVEAISQVAAGEPILSPALLRRLMDRMADQSDTRGRARQALSALSPRERDVVLAIAQGHSNAEIGARLAMTVATVKAHVSHILDKLGLDNSTQIALLAHDAGMA
jgi:DNA-binding NarL/FixJ family response regulator